MEVVAAAASVAGILGFLGESLDGTKKLRNFFIEISVASTVIDQFLKDIDSLLQAMHSIKSLVEKLPSDFWNDVVASLQMQLKDYTKDVSLWLQVATALRPDLEKGAKSWMRKTWVALNSKSVNDMRKELDRHKQAFTLSLSILGR